MTKLCDHGGCQTPAGYRMVVVIGPLYTGDQDIIEWGEWLRNRMVSACRHHLAAMIDSLQPVATGRAHSPQSVRVIPVVEEACPSPSAAGRTDRCGLFSFPQRCRPGHCSMPDIPEGVVTDG